MKTGKKLVPTIEQNVTVRSVSVTAVKVAPAASRQSALPLYLVSEQWVNRDCLTSLSAQCR